MAQFGNLNSGRIEWDDAAEMLQILEPFAALNHALLPSGGGMDGDRFLASHEVGCLEMQVSPGYFYLFKPRKLFFQRLPGHPGESYFVVDLEEIPPTGRGDVVGDEYELVLDLGPDGYVSRRRWDEGHLGLDEDGYEIPIPDNARLITRYLKGKIMLVAKQSIYNSRAETYDARHTRMTLDALKEEVRAFLS
ncbi:hypothetical protein [Pelagibacterium sediminicola]|uniref:hypothetical protein n=1 Tax=Pelagibacterium sediminicola TaxID=2248761 RepID=UPI001300B198|nr:hypothetical protein [Pelagibacterium sediminicola]